MGIETALLAASVGIGATQTAYGAIAQGRQLKHAESEGAANRAAFAALQAEPEPEIPGEDATRKARRLSIASQMRRRGRAATILTADTGGLPQTLGGG